MGSPKVSLPTLMTLIKTLQRRVLVTHQGPFNNYVDKITGGGVKKVCFCPCLGYKTVHANKGVKKWQTSVHADKGVKNGKILAIIHFGKKFLLEKQK